MTSSTVIDWLLEKICVEDIKAELFAGAYYWKCLQKKSVIELRQVVLNAELLHIKVFERCFLLFYDTTIVHYTQYPISRIEGVN